MPYHHSIADHSRSGRDTPCIPYRKKSILLFQQKKGRMSPYSATSLANRIIPQFNHPELSPFYQSSPYQLLPFIYVPLL